MPNSAIISTTGRTQATQTLYNNVVRDAIRLLSVSGSAKTIASGAVTLAPANGEGHYTIDTEASAVTDDLDTVNGGADGDIVTLVAANYARTVVVRSGVGNISLAGGKNVILNTVEGLILRKSSGNWTPLATFGQASVLTNKAGAERAAGDVVVFDLTADSAYTTTTNERDVRVAGVVRNATASNGGGEVLTENGKICAVNCDTGAVARGQFLITSTTAGKAKALGYAREPGVFALALSAKSAGSVGTVQAMLVLDFRQALGGTSGWALGGTSDVVTAQKFAMATETWTTVAGAALPAGRGSAAGIGGGSVAGYAQHGSPASNSRYKLTYATETCSTLTSSDLSLRFFRSGVNFTTKGFAAGGDASGTAKSTSRKTTYATDGEATGPLLSTARNAQGGVSDNTHVYISGNTDARTDRMDAATETLSYYPAVNTGSYADGYNFASFPASAGYRAYNNGSGTVYSRKLTFATATDASNASSPTGNIAKGQDVTDGVARAYFCTSAAANKLDASTGTYTSVAGAVSAVADGATLSYGAL